jgi:hypothetical protein
MFEVEDGGGAVVFSSTWDMLAAIDGSLGIRLPRLNLPSKNTEGTCHFFHGLFCFLIICW